jgi:hypothetical protein
MTTNSFRQVDGSGWPAMPTKPLAQLRFSPAELAEKLGIQFAESNEYFDASKGTLVELLPSGMKYALFNTRTIRFLERPSLLRKIGI